VKKSEDFEQTWRLVAEPRLGNKKLCDSSGREI
jgi:hypothetical protein